MELKRTTETIPSLAFCITKVQGILSIFRSKAESSDELENTPQSRTTLPPGWHIGPRHGPGHTPTRPAFPIDPDQFERAYPVCDFETLIRWENFTAPIAGELDNYRPILGRYIKRLKAQRVLYSEIMIPGAGLFRDKVEAVEKVQAFRDWITRQEGGEIQVEFLALSSRTKSPEQMQAGEERILALHKAGLIVGIALAGPERGHPVKPFHSTFARFHHAGLKIEIHALRIPCEEYL